LVPYIRGLLQLLLQSVNIDVCKNIIVSMVPDYVLDSGLQAAGEAVLVSQAAQQAQLQVRPVFIEKCV
jgi:hypothetical protein